MPEEIIYDVYWDGPYNWKDCQDKEKPHHVLYPVYGLDALLYIGLSFRLVGQRLKEHWWLDDLQDNATVRLGSVGKFTTWEKWNEVEHHQKSDNGLVKKIEALLIYAHKPAYNTKNKQSIDIAEGIRIFNTGNHGQLLPEISYLYHWGQ